MFFVFQKYFGQPPFWTFIGHVAYMLRKWQHFHQCPKMGVCTEWVDGGGWMNQDFNQKIRIPNEIFSAEKSVSHEFLLSRQGLL